MISSRRTPRTNCDIKEFCKPFKLQDEKLCEVMDRLKKALEKGLDKDSASSVRCYPTYVQDFPTGEEVGDYLVIDLGGAHFRVMLVTLEPRHKYQIEARIFSFPEDRMTGTADPFFDYITECLEMFMKEMNLTNRELGLGFCFSFPVQMEALNRGHLTHWVKHFNVSGVIGKNVVELLQNSIDRKKLKIKPIFLVNDTIACLMSCSGPENTCRVGVIIGTGTNACYVEKIENIPKFDGDRTKPYMIINTELGNFGNDGSLDDIRTDFDEIIDSNSHTPGTQIFEKMVSSMHFSELIRVTILKCIERKLLFDGQSSEMLERKKALLPEFIYEIESDTTYELNKTLAILEVMKLKQITIQDCVNVRYICKTICQRSAHLMATAIAALAHKISVCPLTIAYDGSVYRKHPNFKEIMKEKIREMTNPNIALNHRLAEDGSGRGAALVVAMYMSDKPTKPIAL